MYLSYIYDIFILLKKCFCFINFFWKSDLCYHSFLPSAFDILALIVSEILIYKEKKMAFLPSSPIHHFISSSVNLKISRAIFSRSCINILNIPLPPNITFEWIISRKCFCFVSVFCILIFSIISIVIATKKADKGNSLFVGYNNISNYILLYTYAIYFIINPFVPSSLSIVLLKNWNFTPL